MSTIQRFDGSLAAFLLLLLFVTPVGAVKPERPDKPGGGGKPPTEMDPLVQVVFVDTGTDMVIDGNMIEWVELGCSLFPQYWAGKVWKKETSMECWPNLAWPYRTAVFMLPAGLPRIMR